MLTFRISARLYASLLSVALVAPGFAQVGDAPTLRAVNERLKTAFEIGSYQDQRASCNRNTIGEIFSDAEAYCPALLTQLAAQKGPEAQIGYYNRLGEQAGLGSNSGFYLMHALHSVLSKFDPNDPAVVNRILKVDFKMGDRAFSVNVGEEMAVDLGFSMAFFTQRI
jgi:hypothetical protein